MHCSPNVVVSLENASVEIPLRGQRASRRVDDPRIFHNRRGELYLRALDNVSLEIRRGERIGLVGGNGNGKTTLLKLIAGLVPAATGKVTVHGSIRSMLTIGAGSYPALTGRRNAQLRYHLLGVRTMSVEAFVADVEDFAMLGAFFDMPINTYSSGMQSRLQFAMSTVEPADILLLDEWMGVADNDFQQKAHERLETYVAKNEAFLFASHDHELLERMTRRRLRLDMGRVIEEPAEETAPASQDLVAIAGR